ncbi:MAG TPA: hypothetical protein VFZ27_10630 [Terriglobia bacterium]|nr:hypothetical protein [Terriglobia bacterium]
MANSTDGSPEFNPMDPTGGPSEMGGTTGKVKEAKETIRRAADKAESKAGALADDAVTKVDEKREAAAEAMRGAADTLHRVAGGGGKAVKAAYAAGKQLQASADFLEEHDFRGSLGEAERFVKSHPAESLIAAAVAGFLVGRAVRRI